ncbi:MAG: TrmH family RNA methyltransferase [Candidatus Nanopelagicales bacterium]
MASLRRARTLKRKAERQGQGRFLAEGPQAVREALRAALAQELFVDQHGSANRDELAQDALAQGIPVQLVSDTEFGGLTDTVMSQGILAIAGMPEQPTLAEFALSSPTLIAVAVAAADPGNVGTLIRIADAAGADGVILTAGSCDPYNGKAVRASTGSLFHLPVLTGFTFEQVRAALPLDRCQFIATTGTAEVEVFSAELRDVIAAPTAWVFGNEARGLAPEVIADCDLAVRIPIYGRAESLNVGAAAAVCLYASATAAR